MVDLGLFNFVKTAKAQGKSKEEIVATLTNAHWDQNKIEEAFAAVESNSTPVKSTTTTQPEIIRPASYDEFARPTILTVLCGYFFIVWISSAIRFLFIMVSLAGSAASFNLSLNSTEAIVTYVFNFFAILAILGIWFMKKWGVYLYIVSVLVPVVFIFMQLQTLNLGLSLILGLGLGLGVQLVLIIFGLKYLHRMT